MDFSLSLRNDPADLARLSAWLEELKTAAALSDRDHFRIDLALAEAVANVIDHGSLPGPDAAIQVRANVTATNATVAVDDPGEPFDPLARAEKALPTRLEDAEPGGLGILLIRKYADACRYDRLDGCNRLTMTFLRRAE